MVERLNGLDPHMLAGVRHRLVEAALGFPRALSGLRKAADSM